MSPELCIQKSSFVPSQRYSSKSQFFVKLGTTVEIIQLYTNVLICPDKRSLRVVRLTERLAMTGIKTKELLSAGLKFLAPVVKAARADKPNVLINCIGCFADVPRNCLNGLKGAVIRTI